jgi:probable F420-dependent oxidoreductase
VKVDALVTVGLEDWAQAASQVEQAGFDGVLSPELAHDPFLPLALAAPATSRLELATGIAVAFARTPMTVAVTASDIHRLSGGRLVLGLGSQVRAHITRRYSMPWSRPAERMREFVLALRAIWAAWNGAAPLEFSGEFYQHTLMTPMFDQGPSPVGAPRIAIAAVGPAMTRVAGEVADGLLLHAFTTPAYARDITAPRLAAGLAAAGRDRAEIEVSLPIMATVAATGAERASALAQFRSQIAFYASTPAYRPVLDHHGWGELGEELHRLSRQGEWATMASLVSDDVLDAFTVIGDTPEAVGAAILRRYGGIVDRAQIGFDPRKPDHAMALRAALTDAR